jgi:hypothetical protein
VALTVPPANPSPREQLCSRPTVDISVQGPRQRAHGRRKGLPTTCQLSARASCCEVRSQFGPRGVVQKMHGRAGVQKIMRTRKIICDGRHSLRGRKHAIGRYIRKRPANTEKFRFCIRGNPNLRATVRATFPV